MRRLLILSSVVALLTVVPASAAQAATLTFAQPCFASQPGFAPDQPLRFTLTGGTPGYNWQVKLNDINTINGVDVRGTFDAAGNATGAITQYSVRALGLSASRGRTATYTATQGPNLFGQVPIAQANVTVTNAVVDIARSRGSAFRKRTWKISGIKPFFGSSSTYYASWVKGTKGKRVVKRSRLGRAKGACGYLKTKRVVPPARRSGQWTIYVHQGKKLNKKKALGYTFRVFVF